MVSLKSKMEISQNFLAFSEYMNFNDNILTSLLWIFCQISDKALWKNFNLLCFPLFGNEQRLDKKISSNEQYFHDFLLIIVKKDTMHFSSHDAYDDKSFFESLSSRNVYMRFFPSKMGLNIFWRSILILGKVILLRGDDIGKGFCCFRPSVYIFVPPT